MYSTSPNAEKAVHDPIFCWFLTLVHLSDRSHLGGKGLSDAAAVTIAAEPTFFSMAKVSN